MNGSGRKGSEDSGAVSARPDLRPLALFRQHSGSDTGYSFLPSLANPRSGFWKEIERPRDGQVQPWEDKEEPEIRIHLDIFTIIA
jgi:hypothetical protein